MKRFARATLKPQKVQALSSKRTAEERIQVSPDKLHLTLAALHWEQRKPATSKERSLYNVTQAYGGNDNGDFFEGGRNVVWACRNAECTNKQDCKHDKGLNRFLKYEQNDHCPWCGSDDIYDWEHEAFGTKGELLAKTHDGRYRYETWKGHPVNVNHDDKRRIGQIHDVWIDPPNKAVVELISIDKQGPHQNESICRKIQAGLVDSGSMELLTGVGMCAVCFNVHHSDEDFCNHLADNKGGMDLRTGMHVFEICKSITGCGHAIIATGDPADSGALVRTILAGKDETNLNPMSERVDTRSAKPEAPKAAKRVDTSRPVSARRAEAAPGEYVSEKPLPPMDNMKEQMDAFGNFDSTRSAEEVRMAKMTPQEREEHGLFMQWKAAQANGGNSPAVAAQKTLRIDKEFIAAALKRAVKTKKISAQLVADALVNITSDTQGFIDALSDRKAITKAFDRLGRRKAQLTDIDDASEIIMDVVADALIVSGENLKQTISDVTVNDALDGASALIDNDARPDFEDYLNEDDSASDGEEGEPTVTHRENGYEDPNPEPDSSDDDMNEPKKVEAQKSGDYVPGTSYPERSLKTEKTPGTEADSTKQPDNAPGANIEKGKPAPRAMKTEATPGTEASAVKVVLAEADPKLHKILSTRLAQIESQMEGGVGNLDVLMEERAKITAQMSLPMRSPKPELTPGTEASSTSLGGNGQNENPKPVDSPEGTRSPKPELTPGTQEGSENLGGNGQNENPKPVSRMAQLERATDCMRLIEAGNMEGVTPADIAMLKEMGILPKDFKAAQAMDATDGVKTPKLNTRDPKTELTPGTESESKEGVNVEKGMPERKVTLESTPGTSDIDLRKAQSDGSGMVVKDEDVAALKGQGVSTKPGEADSHALENKNLEDPTKVGGRVDEFQKNENVDEPSPIGGASKEQADKLGWDKNTPTDGSLTKDLQKKENLDKLTPMKDTYPDAESLRSAELTAEFVEVKQNGLRSSSYWRVFAQADPIFEIKLNEAYPGEVVSKFPEFASEEYSDMLITAIRKAGVEAVQKDEFGGAGRVFNQEERLAIRKAQLATPGTNPAPAAQAQPANIAPEVADKLQDDATPGIPLTNLLANMLAPLVAESDSMSVAGLMEDLVNLAADQDKVTELTTQLNTNVQNIKSAAGLPDADAAAGTDPAPDAAAAAPVAGQPGQAPMTPTQDGMQVNAKKIGPNEARYAKLLQAQRIEPIVKEEQACGLIPNYNFLRTAAGGSLSRSKAQDRSSEVYQARVAELMALPEETYIHVESEIRKACRLVRSNSTVLPGAKRDANRRGKIFAQMNEEEGGTLLETLSGNDITATEFKPEGAGKRLSNLKWASAGVNPTAHDAAAKARESRGTQR